LRWPKLSTRNFSAWKKRMYHSFERENSEEESDEKVFLTAEPLV
jgi:hypothetical protein